MLLNSQVLYWLFLYFILQVQEFPLNVRFPFMT